MFDPMDSVSGDMVRVLYPENGWLTIQKVINMAKDEVANSSDFTERFDGKIDEAIEILSNNGKVTFGRV